MTKLSKDKTMPTVSPINPASTTTPPASNQITQNHQQMSHMNSDHGIQPVGANPQEHTNEKATYSSAQHEQQASPLDGNVERGVVGQQDGAPPDYAPRVEERYQPEPVKETHVPRMATPLALLGKESATVDCPRCQTNVETNIRQEAGDKATMWSVIICLCAGVCFAWIPCVMSDCKDTIHSCPNCNVPLVTVTPDGNVKIDPNVAARMQVQSQYTGPTEQMHAQPMQAHFPPIQK